MDSKIITVIGLAVTLIGTIITFMKIFTTQAKTVGTRGSLANAQNDFVKERKWVYAGLCLIVLGTVLQIIGTFLN